ncbi:MAG: symmetrical bis(5'-nucleosyl)-tetraphosphatase [Psychrobium sp.]
MATYFVGDLQACFDEFELLLAKVNFDHQQDKLYLVGDLIGRGPKPKETLDFLIAHSESMLPVLGNHDLHFLSVANGIKANKANDNFTPLLDSAELATYIDYLRQQPLLRYLKQHSILISHAGLTPQWDLATAIEQADLVHHQLTAASYVDLLSTMYRNINDWHQCEGSHERLIFTINALTRMRFCNTQGHLEFATKNSPAKNTDNTLSPWFELAPDTPQYRSVFGHWAALMGETNNPNYVALDTGCLWGNWLTCWRLEDNQYFTQNSLQIC